MDSAGIDYTSTWETYGGFPSEATLEERQAVIAALIGW